MKFLIMVMMFNMLVPQIFCQVINMYDMMQFVLQWNPSVCSRTIKPCINPVPQTFTIHGLWPADALASSLHFQKPQSPQELQDFNNDMALLNQDQNSVNALHHVWPSVITSRPDDQFWEHEWEQHGFGVRTLIDVKTYFEAATRIHDTMIAINGNTDLKDYLSRVGIQPGRTFTRGQLRRALNPLAMGIDIRCHFNGTHNFLWEVIFCLDKSSLYSFVSCQRGRFGWAFVRLTGSCEPMKPFYFPS